MKNKRVILYPSGEIKFDGRFIRERVIMKSGAWHLVKGGLKSDWNEDIAKINHVEDQDKFEMEFLSLVDGLGIGQKTLWTINEAAVFLGISTTRIYQAQKTLNIGERVGRNTWVLRWEDVDAIKERVGMFGKQMGLVEKN